MEKNNSREKKQKATKTVGGNKRKRITIICTNHDDDCADNKGSWSDLPCDILEFIKKRLSFMDQVNLRRICKSWSCSGRVPSLPHVPWLLVFDNKDDYSHCWFRKEKEKEKNMVDSCKLVDSKNKKTYTIDANVIKAKLKITNFKALKVHESKYGWLLISNPQYPSRLFLYSPFLSEGYNLIELPVLRNCSIIYATFTSNPLDKDCKILTLNMNSYDNTFVIYTYHHRGDQGWCSSRQNFTGNSTMGRFLSRGSYWKYWMYSEGNIYFASYDGCSMGKFNMVLGEWNDFPVLPLTAHPEESNLHYHYIVKSSDGTEVFLISDSNITQTKNDSSGYNPYSKQTKNDSWGYSNSHHILRLDLSSMIWEDLDSIGDHVLFIGDGYNSVLNSSVLKSNGERKDISDKIYYCKDDELKYCSVHDYTHKTKTKTKTLIDQEPYRKQNCSKHYGSIATARCRKMLIDPPPL